MNTDAKVLLVDDMRSMRRIMRSILKTLGFRNIEDAEDGAQALKWLRSGAFDLVITDWDMPNMPGIELLKAIRADDALKSLPVVLVTAERDKHHVVEAAEVGVDGYVVKPFSPETLRAKLERIV